MLSGNIIKGLSVFIETVVFIEILVITGYTIFFTSKVNLGASDNEIVALYAGIFASTINLMLLYHIIKHFIKHSVRGEVHRFLTLKIVLAGYIVFGVALLLTVFVLEDDIIRYVFIAFMFSWAMYFVSLFSVKS
jgi:hypothetical protein